MPEEAAQPQVLTQPPRRSPLKIILFVFLGLIVLVLAVEGIYYFRLRKAERELPQPTLPYRPEEAQMETIDILALPGWDQPPNPIGEVKINPDGSLKITSEPRARWYILNNYKIRFQVKGDFEARFGISTAGRQNLEKKGWGNILFYSAHFTKNPNFVQVGINQRNEIFLSFVDTQKQEKIDLIKGIPAPSSGNLKVRFENVGTGGAEGVAVYDEDTGQELGRTLLPLPLFSKELYLAIELGNVSQDPQGAEMTVSHFKIVVPEGSGNVLKS